MAEVDRLQCRMKELLRFLRSAERQSEFLDLNTLLRGTVQMMGGRMANAHLKVNEQLAAKLSPITGDQVLLEQVFMSLIGNAIEAIPESGGILTITSGTTLKEAGVTQVFAEIRDTGMGIPEDKILRIFDPFYTTKVQGTGLGLAIAKKFTESHGGAIPATA